MGNADLVRRALEDFFAYDDSTLLDLISTDAEWHGVDSDLCDCRGREKLMTRLRDCRTKGFLTALVEVRDGAGDAVFVRWYGERMHSRFGVPDGIASVVLTVSDGRVVRIKDYAGQDHALEGAGLVA